MLPQHYLLQDQLSERYVTLQYKYTYNLSSRIDILVFSIAAIIYQP